MTERERLERYLHEEIDAYYGAARHQDREDDALKTVCHVIYWATALDELHRKTGGATYEGARDVDANGRVLLGVRFARNRASHQFPQLLEVSAGAMFPLVLPAPLFEVVWRDVASLPAPDPTHAKSNEKLEPFYRDLLAGKPVRFTFDSVWKFFAAVPRT